MGREIRRVPPDWQHPKEEELNWQGDKWVREEVYIPLFDGSFEEGAKEWLARLELWLAGKHSHQLDPDLKAKDYPQTIRGYCEYAGRLPDHKSYRPEWPEHSATAFQIYETVTEGTPISPVFQSEDEMLAWLLIEGDTERAAKEFIRIGYMPAAVAYISPES